MKIVITGGAGFIGSHLAEYCYYLKPSELVIVDNMGYAANYDNISHIINDDIVKFVLADITNYAIYKDFLQDTDVLIHTAAESHVDNSFFDPLRFVKSNVEGTQVLLHACKEYSVKKIIHFSTDEVYGDKLEGTFYEGSVLNPTNPYSASKAAAEMMVKSYIKSFNLPIIVVRPNNTYGIRQHWEKLIPTCCMHLKKGKKIPIHGDGIAIRDYLSVKDLCRAIDIIIERAAVGDIYNIGVEDSYTVNAVVKLFSEYAGVEDSYHHTEDRPYNDKKYPLDLTKIHSLGWKPLYSLANDVGEIYDWYSKKDAPFAHGWFKND